MPKIKTREEILQLGVQKSMNGAKGALQEYGRIDNTIVFLSGDGNDPDVHPYNFTLENEDDKTPLAADLRKRAQQHNTWGYIQASIVWLFFDYKDLGEAVDSGQAASVEEGEYYETLVIEGLTQNYHCGVAAAFVRSGKEIVFLKEITIKPDDTVLGWFSNLL